MSREREEGIQVRRSAAQERGGIAPGGRPRDCLDSGLAMSSTAGGRARRGAAGPEDVAAGMAHGTLCECACACGGELRRVGEGRSSPAGRSSADAAALGDADTDGCDSRRKCENGGGEGSGLAR